MEREATNSDIWYSFSTNIDPQKEKRNSVYAYCSEDLGKYIHRRVVEAVVHMQLWGLAQGVWGHQERKKEPWI